MSGCEERKIKRFNRLELDQTQSKVVRTDRGGEVVRAKSSPHVHGYFLKTPFQGEDFLETENVQLLFHYIGPQRCQNVLW